MIEGDGCPVDRVIAISSTARRRSWFSTTSTMTIAIEGQGAYICLILRDAGLLHGCIPHGPIACYEMGRKCIDGMPQVACHSKTHRVL